MAYPNVSNSHPRIWLTPQRVADLKNDITSGDTLVRYNTLKSYVDGHINQSYPPSIYDFALLYQLTGTQSYALRAIALASGSLALGNSGIPPNPGWTDSGLSVRDSLPAIAITYDWCNDQIVTLGLKTFFVSGMTQWADYMWPETYGTSNPPGPPIDNEGNPFFAQTQPLSNYYTGYLGTWMIGLALYYDTTKASGYVNQALNRWNTVIQPQLTSSDLTYSASGGYLCEGTSYGAGRTTLYYFYNLAAHFTACGDNLFTSGTTWCKGAVIDCLHLTAPNLGQLYSGGDQSANSNSGAAIVDDLRGMMLQGASYLDTTTAGYARKWLDSTVPPNIQTATDYWRDVLWHNSATAASVDYTTALPSGYYSNGAGWVTSRSSFATGGTQVAMICGPITGTNSDPGSHSDEAANGFVIWREGWLVMQAKVNSNNGIQKDASYNNSVSVGGNTQYLGSHGSFIKHFSETSGYAYFSGDAADAYQKSGSTTWLNGYRRDLLFLKPNFIIVCDRLNAPDNTLTKKFHVNSIGPVATTSNTFTLTGAIGSVIGSTTKLFGTTQLPTSPTISVLPLFLNTNSPSTVTSYRVDVAAPIGNTVDYLLNTMETAPSAQGAATAVTNLVTNATGVQGVQLTANGVNYVAVFEMRNQAAAAFTFNITGNGSKTFVVPTDHPNTVYNWSMTPTSGSAAATGSITADAQGVLNWSTSTSGAVAVAMTTAAAPPPFSVYQPLPTAVNTAQAGSAVSLSGDTWTTTTGSVTFGSATATLNSWQNTEIDLQVPTQASYPHTDNVVVSWNTSVTAASGAHFSKSTNQFMNATNPASLTPGAGQSFSFAGWVYMDSKSAENAWLSKFNTSSSQRSYVLTYDPTGGADRFRFYVCLDGTSNTLFNIQDTHLGSASTATWYFVACGWNASTKKSFLSINNLGLDQTSVQATNSAFASNADFYLSSYNADGTSWVDGRMDNWGAWFGKAFSAAEITALYNGGAGVNYSDVLANTTLSGVTAFWQLDDAGGAGAVWVDKTGTVNLTGGTSSAAPTTIGGIVNFNTLTAHTDTYTGFVTTAPAATGSLSISNFQQPLATTVTSAKALSTIDISGSAFGSSSGSVTFGTNSATVTAWTNTDITCIVPTQDSYPLSVAVKVTGSNGQSDSKTFTVNSANATITNIQQPLSTVITTAVTGSTVDVIGTFFGPTSGSVTFNGVAATVTAWTTTDITCIVPNQASLPETGTVLVTTSDSRTASQGGFTTTAVSPKITDIERPLSTAVTSGLVTTTVDVIGTNFRPISGSVTFNGVAATVTTWTGTDVTLAIPAQATYPNTGTVTLTTNDGLTASQNNFLTLKNPAITNTQAPLGTVITTAVNGTALDIVGTNFGASRGGGSVTFNGVAATINSWSDTDINVTVPGQASYPNIGTIVVITDKSLTASMGGFTTTTIPSIPSGTFSMTLTGGGSLNPSMTLTLNIKVIL